MLDIYNQGIYNLIIQNSLSFSWVSATLQILCVFPHREFCLPFSLFSLCGGDTKCIVSVQKE